MTERAKEQLSRAAAALATFEAAVATGAHSPLAREAAMLRLMYTFNTILDACRKLIWQEKRIKAGSAETTIRAARHLGWLSDQDASAIVEAGRVRRLALQAYRADIRDEIGSRLPSHAAAMRRWIEALQQRSLAAPEPR